MHTFSAGEGRNVARLCSAIKDDGSLHPGNHKVCALAHNILLDTHKSVVDHSPVTSLN